MEEQAVDGDVCEVLARTMVIRVVWGRLVRVGEVMFNII